MGSPVYSHFAKLLDRGTIDLPAVNAPLAGALSALTSGLAGKAPLDSAALTGIPTAPTAAPGTNTTQLATTAFTQAAISSLISAAPGALDTLDELAAALGDDANFAATITNSLAGKQPLAANLTSWSAINRGTGFDTAAALAVNAAGGFFTQGSALSASTIAASGAMSVTAAGTIASFVDSGTGRTWRFSSGNLTPLGNNQADLGGSATRIANGYFVGLDATSITASGAVRGGSFGDINGIAFSTTYGVMRITGGGSNSFYLGSADDCMFQRLSSGGFSLKNHLSAFMPIECGRLTASGALTGSQATNTLDLSPNWNTTGSPSLIYGRVTNTASGASANLIDLGTAAGGSLFKVGKAGNVDVRDSTVGGYTVPSLGFNGQNTGFTAFGNYGLNICSGGAQIAFCDARGGINPAFGVTGNFAASTVVVGGQYGMPNGATLANDAADILAQRRGTNAQTSRLYTTFTARGAGTTNLEALEFKGQAAGSFIIQSLKGSAGGTARDIEFRHGATDTNGTITNGALIATVKSTGIDMVGNFVATGTGAFSHLDQANVIPAGAWSMGTNWVDNGNGTYTSSNATGYNGIQCPSMPDATYQGGIYILTFKITAYTSGTVSAFWSPSGDAFWATRQAGQAQLNSVFVWICAQKPGANYPIHIRAESGFIGTIGEIKLRRLF